MSSPTLPALVPIIELRCRRRDAHELPPLLASCRSPRVLRLEAPGAASSRRPTPLPFCPFETGTGTAARVPKASPFVASLCHLQDLLDCAVHTAVLFEFASQLLPAGRRYPVIVCSAIARRNAPF